MRKTTSVAMALAAFPTLCALAGDAPSGAAALGYTKCVIRETPPRPTWRQAATAITSGSGASGTRNRRPRSILLMLSGQSHGAQKPHFTFISGVRAYVPSRSALPVK